MSSIEKVAVIGSGVMGSGIAAQAANAGIDVILLDILPQEGADREMQTGDRFLFDAQERHRDYWEHLISRVEMSWPNQRAAAIRQHPK